MLHQRYFVFRLMILVVILCLSGCTENNYQPGEPENQTPSPTGPLQSGYHYYFGQFHSHTSLSDGTGTPDEAYAFARDIGKADFFAITDHSHYFDHDLDCTESSEWADLKRASDKFSVEGKFIAIAGFEMSFSSATTGRGHINTFNTSWFETKNNPAMDLPGYYEKIKTYPESILQWNHPGHFSGISTTSAVMNRR